MLALADFAHCTAAERLDVAVVPIGAADGRYATSGTVRPLPLEVVTNRRRGAAVLGPSGLGLACRNTVSRPQPLAVTLRIAPIYGSRISLSLYWSAPVAVALISTTALFIAAVVRSML